MADKEKAKRPRGRPRKSDDEKARRGTLRLCRVRERAEKDGTSLPPASKAEPPAVPPKDYARIAAGYCSEVLRGQIVACRWIRLACERQERDRARAASDGAWPYVWSDAHAAEACEFLERLPHVEGRWASPTITLEPAQVFIVALLFGWRQRIDVALRRFTLFYLEMGRKGAKSTLMAGIALFHMLREREPGASVVCGATTGQQARIVFGIMQKMVRASSWLRAQQVTALANAIVTEDGNAKPINAKASTQDGLNPSCIVLDESHAQSFELHDVLKSAQGARPNPLLLCPTTAGYDLLSVGYALRTTLTKVLQGIFESEHFLGFIFTLDAGDDWRHVTSWQKANPMLGTTPSLAWVRSYCADAQQTPGLEGEFRVKVCSEWGQGASAWLSMTRWDACEEPGLKIEDFSGEPCWIGGDLAQIDDLAAVARVFERRGILYGFVQFYLPELVVDERAKAVPAYRAWADAGVLTKTPGNMIDYAQIEADIRASCKAFTVKAITFDQFGSVQIAGNLVNDGFPAEIVSKSAKSFTLPSRELETRVKHGTFRHDGNTCLRWNASNAVVTRRIDDSILPKKESPESPNKIDGIDALIQAIGAWVNQQAVAEPDYQVYIVGKRA